MQKSILVAIKEGEWDYEPREVDDGNFDATKALPGSPEKLNVLAARVQAGLPLWNRRDRITYDEEATTAS